MGKQRKGFTLIELMGVMAITAGVVFATIYYFTHASESELASKAVQQVQEVIGATRDWAQPLSTASYSTVSIATLRDADYLDDVLYANPLTANPWGKELTLTYDTTTTLFNLVSKGIASNQSCLMIANVFNQIAGTTGACSGGNVTITFAY